MQLFSQWLQLPKSLTKTFEKLKIPQCLKTSEAAFNISNCVLNSNRMSQKPTYQDLLFYFFVTFYTISQQDIKLTVKLFFTLMIKITQVRLDH